MICSMNRERFVKQMKTAEIFPQEPEHGDDGSRHIRYHALFFGETRGQEVESLFQKFRQIVVVLQQSVSELTSTQSNDGTDGVSTTRRTTQLASNEEVKLVCTLLNCTQELLNALQNLARIISRLQAARDIAVTQSGQ